MEIRRAENKEFLKVKKKENDYIKRIKDENHIIVVEKILNNIRHTFMIKTHTKILGIEGSGGGSGFWSGRESSRSWLLPTVPIDPLATYLDRPGGCSSPLASPGPALHIPAISGHRSHQDLLPFGI